MDRRGFLKALGVGAAALAVEPVRKMWFVPSNAPVGSRLFGVDLGAGPDWTVESHVRVGPGGRILMMSTPSQSFSWNDLKRVGSTDLTFSVPPADGPWFYDEDASLKFAADWAEAQGEAARLIDLEADAVAENLASFGRRVITLPEESRAPTVRADDLVFQRFRRHPT